ncbi:hypothetical protein WA577_004580 [Blastocystis sp. JDR]
MFYTLSILRNHTEEEYMECVIYWILFGVLYIVDLAFPSISSYLPFFYPFKVSLLLASFSKDINLCQVVYESVFVKYLDYPASLESKRTIAVEKIKNADMNDPVVKKD